MDSTSMQNKPLPKLLQLEIERAYESLQAHPKGQLTLGHRRAIYATMSDNPMLESGLDKRGHIRRTHCGILAVLKIYPMWEKFLPDNFTLLTFITIAQKRVRGETRPELYDHFETVAFDYEESFRKLNPEWRALRAYDPAAILNTALHLIVIARDDDVFAYESVHSVDYSFDEKEVEIPYDFDVAGFAAFCYSNGWMSQSSMNPTRRKEFWMWWLAEAVPQAYFIV
jgi:hypothetical protein